MLQMVVLDWLEIVKRGRQGTEKGLRGQGSKSKRILGLKPRWHCGGLLNCERPHEL
jgi:hypothetical protein